MPPKKKVAKTKAKKHAEKSATSATPATTTVAAGKCKSTSIVADPPPNATSSRKRPASAVPQSESDDSDYEAETTPTCSAESLVNSATSSAAPDDNLEPIKYTVTLTDPKAIAELLHFPGKDWKNSAILRTNKKFSSGKLLDSASLRRLKVYDEFVTYFRNIGWSWLLSIPRGDMYQEIATEFFTTFHFTETDDIDVKSISFRLFNQHHSLSLTEWNVRLGIVTAEAALSDSHRSALCGLPSSMNCSANSQSVWEILAPTSANPFDVSRSVASDLNDPILRICHMFLGYNLTDRSTSFAKMGCNDLFFLWCMHKSIKVNLGYWIAYSMHLISTHPSRHLTLCHLLGAYVIRNVDLIVTDSLTLCKPPSQFDIDALLLSKVIFINFAGEPQFFQPGACLPSSCTSAGTKSLDDVYTEVQTLKENVATLSTAVASIKKDLATLGETILDELKKK